MYDFTHLFLYIRILILNSLNSNCELSESKSESNEPTPSNFRIEASIELRTTNSNANPANCELGNYGRATFWWKFTMRPSNDKKRSGMACPNKGNIATLPSNEGLGPVMMYLLYLTHMLENMGFSSDDENMVEPTSDEKHQSVRFTMFYRVDGLSCFCLLGGL